MTNSKFNTLAIILLFSFLLCGYTDSIDTSLPAGTDDPSEADDNMRRIQGGFQEILAVEHDVDLTSTVITGDGTHTDITTDSIVNAGTLATTGDFSVNTNKFTVTAASGNTLVAGTLDITGNIDPTTYETTNGGFLDEDDMASDATDKVASQQSIKAYADSLIAALVLPSGLTGGNDSNGETVIGELQLKWGDVTVGVNTNATVTFTTAFDNACFQGIIGGGSATPSQQGGSCHTLTKTSLKIYNFSGTSKNYRWFAIGR